MRISKTFLTAALAVAVQLPALADAIPVNLFKNPNCYCCDLYAKHLQENGFKVEVINTTDMDGTKQKYRIPQKLEGCHTAIVGGYVVEGLVPAQFVQKMLREHRPMAGIALPGMPVGAPGMPGAKHQELKVYAISPDVSPAVYGTF
ncbi:MAG: DUF411 domain-containing protein [Pseudomonadota bacterium]|nr:DUF411 domain-containing protein [Pseudomonadota bacterium]